MLQVEQGLITQLTDIKLVVQCVLYVTTDNR